MKNRFNLNLQTRPKSGENKEANFPWDSSIDFMNNIEDLSFPEERINLVFYVVYYEIITEEIGKYLGGYPIFINNWDILKGYFQYNPEYLLMYQSMGQINLNIKVFEEEEIALMFMHTKIKEYENQVEKNG